MNKTTRRSHCEERSNHTKIIKAITTKNSSQNSSLFKEKINSKPSKNHQFNGIKMVYLSTYKLHFAQKNILNNTIEYSNQCTSIF